ncbi:hypothetical protein SF83666_c09590 [Sinorhizobium fredii CCBAU 83666]|nr:hypothetical protein SF83666_c09590 [Sinorhizobium fredii CCBAU 83666]
MILSRISIAPGAAAASAIDNGSASGNNVRNIDFFGGNDRPL